MRAVRFHEYGDVDVLQIDEVPKPTPSRNAIVARIEAASVNHLDTIVRRGIKPPSELPTTTGNDFAGVVEEVGPGVEGIEPGDRVLGAELGIDWPGTFAEYVEAPIDRIAPLPDGVSFEAGAGVAHAGATAWRAILDYGDLKPAQTCLVHGGSGGVGHIGVQLAAATSASVIATAGSEQARERLRKLGADAAFDYDRDDLATAIDRVAERGVDVVLETHVGEHLDLDVECSAPGSTVAVVGGDDARFSTAGIARGKDVTIQAMGASKIPDLSGVLGNLASLVDRGDLEVVIDDRYPLDAAARAQCQVTESFFGKRIVEP